MPAAFARSNGLRVLAVTNVFPTAEHPNQGVFIADQVHSLQGIGLDVSVVHVPRDVSGMRAYRGVGGLVASEAARVDATIVHLMYGGVMAAAVTKAVTDRATIVSFRGTDLLGGDSGGAATRFRESFGVRASRAAARRAGGCIVMAPGMLDALPDDVERDHVWVIANGIDTTLFVPMNQSAARNRLDWPVERKVVLFPAARHRAEKRFELARAAVTVLAETIPNVELRALEGVPHDEVPVWMNAADVVVLTSTHEGSPDAVKEAVACGIPVVSVDVGDVRDRISGLPGSAIVDARPEQIANGLATAISTQRGDAGPTRAQAWSFETTAERIRDVYAATLGRTEPSAEFSTQ